jgi:hypothetical protein
MMDLHDQHILEWMHKHVHGATMQYLHPAYRDTNNCTVRALRDSLGIHLISAYVLMREQGRKHGHGVYPPNTAKYYRNIAGQLGFQYSELCGLDAHRDYGRTIVTAQRALAPHQRVVFSVRGHVLGFHGGQTSDWANGRRHHIRGAHIFRQQAA